MGKIKKIVVSTTTPQRLDGGLLIFTPDNTRNYEELDMVETDVIACMHGLKGMLEVRHKDDEGYVLVKGTEIISMDVYQEEEEEE